MVLIAETQTVEEGHLWLPLGTCLLTLPIHLSNDQTIHLHRHCLGMDLAELFGTRIIPDGKRNNREINLQVFSTGQLGEG